MLRLGKYPARRGKLPREVLGLCPGEIYLSMLSVGCLDLGYLQLLIICLLTEYGGKR